MTRTLICVLGLAAGASSAARRRGPRHCAATGAAGGAARRERHRDAHPPRLRPGVRRRCTGRRRRLGHRPVPGTPDHPRLPRDHGHRRGRHRPPEPHRHPLRRAPGAHRLPGDHPGRGQRGLRRHRERGPGEPLHHRGGGHRHRHLADPGPAPHPAAGGAPGADRRAWCARPPRASRHPAPRCGTTSPTSSTSPPRCAPWPRTGCPPATPCARPDAASTPPAASRGCRFPPPRSWRARGCASSPPAPATRARSRSSWRRGAARPDRRLGGGRGRRLAPVAARPRRGDRALHRPAPPRAGRRRAQPAPAPGGEAMSLRDRWEGLSPTLRRAPGARRRDRGRAGPGRAPGHAPPRTSAPNGAEERRRLITNLLTDADPRAIGIEGLAERLRRLETHMGQLTASLDKLGLRAGEDPERDALIEGLRRENARQLEDLRRQQEACARSWRRRARPRAAAPRSRPRRRPHCRRRRRRPTATPRTRPLSRIFDPPPDDSSAEAGDPAPAGGRSPTRPAAPRRWRSAWSPPSQRQGRAMRSPRTRSSSPPAASCAGCCCRAWTPRPAGSRGATPIRRSRASSTTPSCPTASAPTCASASWCSRATGTSAASGRICAPRPSPACAPTAAPSRCRSTPTPPARTARSGCAGGW